MDCLIDCWLLNTGGKQPPLYLTLSTNQSYYLSIYPQIYIYIYRSIYLLFYLQTCLSIHRSIYLFFLYIIFKPIYFFLSIFIYLFIHFSSNHNYLSIDLQIFLSIILSIDLSIFHPIIQYPFIFPWIYLSRVFIVPVSQRCMKIKIIIRRKMSPSQVQLHREVDALLT